jgi:hypothetical protein
VRVGAHVVPPGSVLASHPPRFPAVLLAPNPPHHRTRHNEAWLIRQVDNQGTRLPDLQRRFAGETSAVHEKISDHTLALYIPGHIATDRTVEEDTNREGPGGLAGKRIL